MNPCLSTSATTVEGILYWAYGIHDDDGLYSPCLFGENPGRGETGFHDRKVESAIVQKAVRKSLKFDYLIDTIEVLYSEDPQALQSLTQYLSRSFSLAHYRILAELEAYKSVGSQASPIGRQLNEWHKEGLNLIEGEFRSRGWV